MRNCPLCTEPVGEGDRFCEACGHELSQPAAGAPASVTRWVSSTGVAPSCAGCGGTDFGPEGYCESCGQRRAAGPDHAELDLDELAGVSDIGQRHRRNEDAMALGRLPGVALAVVCDGVSSSSRPDAASHAAVDAAAPSLVEALRDGAKPAEAIAGAARAAQAAATLVAGPHPGGNPPSCTFVCAVCTVDAIVVGWVGDSRAYWLPASSGQTEPHHPPESAPAAPERSPASGQTEPDCPPAQAAQCLTIDDSLAGQLAAAGVAVSNVAHGGVSSALVRWLGADATDTVPRLRTLTAPGPGRLLLCSDGLSRYTTTAADLAELVRPAAAPLPAAQELVRYALDRGGADNVTAVLINFPPLEEPR